MLEQYMGYGYLALALAGVGFTACRSRDKARKALASTANSAKNVAVTLLSVFGLIGLLTVFVPPSLIERYLGAEGGLGSLLVGDLLGSIAAGPPVAAYPMAASLLDAGAWAPAVAAFIVSWTLVGFISIPFEARVFGMRFAIWRNVISFVFAMVIGVLMGWVL